MRKSEAESLVGKLQKGGWSIAIVVSLLVAWNSTLTLGLAAGLALICVVGCSEVIVLCILATEDRGKS